MLIRPAPFCLAAIASLALAAPVSAEPQVFDAPEAAVTAVIDALQARDRDALIAIFGQENEDVILTGDPARDRDDWGAFFDAYQEMNRVAVGEDGRATLFVGRDQWPFPVELAQGEGGWSFDTETARDEIVIRRIGRNELDVIDLMKAYVEVQANYRRTDYDGDGVLEFAAHILSSENARDGLYWPDTDGAPESPIGDFIARASSVGYEVGSGEEDPEPYLGYYFHILSQQGENAPGGAYDYMVGDNMLAGHALLAFPADYGETGVMSFMVGENGVVYEADLGEDTIEVANAIETFNPGEGWSPSE